MHGLNVSMSESLESSNTSLERSNTSISEPRKSYDFLANFNDFRLW
jgi:hypothetical protein